MTLERQWINQLQSRWPQVDLRHDTFYDPGTRQILTTDMLVEGVHFTWDTYTPEDVGWKSVAVNLSDIAATGGIPQWVLVSIGVASHNSMATLEGIYRGIEACCQEFHCIVVGGDTVGASETTVSVTVLGTLPQQSNPGRRSTAKPGDILAVSGLHGLSRAGFEVLQRNLPDYDRVRQAHLHPVPLCRLGQRIAQTLPRYAMMDSSDGLADAALRLAEASKVDVILDPKRINIDPEVETLAHQVGVNPLDWVLYGGEDFQLVLSLTPETLALFPELQPVGVIQTARKPGKGQGFLRDEETIRPLIADKTFQHFTQPPARVVSPSETLTP
jgi:thiamine-monophosphate kinase